MVLFSEHCRLTSLHISSVSCFTFTRAKQLTVMRLTLSRWPFDKSMWRRDWVVVQGQAIRRWMGWWDMGTAGGCSFVSTSAGVWPSMEGVPVGETREDSLWILEGQASRKSNSNGHHIHPPRSRSERPPRSCAQLLSPSAERGAMQEDTACRRRGSIFCVDGRTTEPTTEPTTSTGVGVLPDL